MQTYSEASMIDNNRMELWVNHAYDFAAYI